MKINNITEAEQVLYDFVPKKGEMTRKGTTLDRIKPIMSMLGNPQNRLKVVHLAGTSGKTSTAYYVAALLTATGKNVGLTVSPHVDSVIERIQIDGRPIPDKQFCEGLGEFLELIKNADKGPTYFELLYAFTIWILAKMDIDYAVVETGVGGLYDATNVMTMPNKVCVITDIGFDHTRLLGRTLPEIAAQKIGIAHQDNQVFMYEQSDEIMDVINEWTHQHQAGLNLVNNQNLPDFLPNMPHYQKRNWLLAYRTYQYLQERDDLKLLTDQELQKTQTLQIPGRMETVKIQDKTVVLDGAHNVQKMTAFIKSFKQLYPDTKPAVMIALKSNKEYDDLAPLLVPLASRIIVSQFKTFQDLHAVSTDADLLADEFKQAGAKNVQSIKDQNQALKTLLDSPEDVCVITGSFYLLSQLRNNGQLG